jgi:phospholipid transport system substrate-binding protein
MVPWTRRCALVVALLLASPVALGEGRPEGDPRARVEAAHATILEITGRVETREQLVGEITEKMNELLDYEAFAARTLKGRWKKLNASQRKRFTKHFKALIIQTYSKRFKPKTTFEVEYRGPTTWMDEAQTRGEVHTTVKGTRAAADVSYLFAAGQRGKVWRIVDITVDEVSMAQNWRRQFLRVIDKQGFAALVKRIRDKTGKVSSTP